MDLIAQETINTEALFLAQNVNKQYIKMSDAAMRQAKLRRLKATIEKYEDAIFKALETDLRKNRFESALTEVYIIYTEINFAIKNLGRWMKPKKVSANRSNFFTKSQIVQEPKGLNLIIAPWNYPFQLLISPLISAIAAGNCAILKPSELAPATSGVLANLIQETFQPEEIALVEADAEVAKELLRLPFDHIFYTGSTAIGKEVMKAAAENLASVTLELGGKSPVIIHNSANLKKAAKKIAWGKWMNAGQTCIAPDYVFVHENQKDEFISLVKQQTENLYGKPVNTADYGKIISKKHFFRIRHLIDDAVEKGAEVHFGAEYLSDELTIQPTVISSIKQHMEIAHEEIFGPVLLVFTYRLLSEVVLYLNAQPKPLAMYIFTRNLDVADELIARTSAGGTCVNDVMMHISNPNLPFGGVNHSGNGACHGRYGFKAFSHERAVMYQAGIDLNHLTYAPYAGKEKHLPLLKSLL